MILQRRQMNPEVKASDGNSDGAVLLVSLGLITGSTHMIYILFIYRQERVIFFL